MSYEYFPGFYDRLMDPALYQKWLEFTQRHVDRKAGKLLDLACGTGELALEFAFAGFVVTGLDLSSEMIDVATEKALAAEVPIDFATQDMTTFSLPESFDVITCYCDSLNYLETEAAVKATFRNVVKQLNESGMFLFDVHSVYKMTTGFHAFSYGDAEEEIATIWNSFPGESPLSVEHELTFFLLDEESGTYTRVDELHKERTFPKEQYIAWLDEAGFSKIEVYADFTDNQPTETSERIFFVAKK